MAVAFLHRGPERALCVAVKVKLALFWRPLLCTCQSCGISAKESCTQGVEPAQRKKSFAVSTGTGDELSKPFDIRHRGIGVCPAVFQSFFGIEFP